ncbi:hypothetical protein AC579_1661 [Pseudocercospora musae]|uniref:Uncharacterized protein n=1 Tax=Pseudocercospora musae TaxID=113226 RepID=A0A139HIQ0_9PEZI|nr:hypothetical protein AC579_1661 [Pseudocercospora musae]
MAPLCHLQFACWWLAFISLRSVTQHGLFTAAILFIDHRYTTATRKVVMISRIFVAICFGIWIYQRVESADWTLYVSDAAFGLYHCYPMLGSSVCKNRDS